jgi:hypothetical protein
MKTHRLAHILIGSLLCAALLAACGGRATPPPTATSTTEPLLTPTSTRTPPFAPTNTGEPTLTPTASPTITLTPTQTPIPPTPTPRAPLLAHDLLYLSEGQLKLWNHLTQRVEVLVGPETAEVGQVLAYDASADGRRMALQISDPLTDTYRLAYYDRDTLSLQMFYTSTVADEKLLGLDLSDDGLWIAYIPQEPALSLDEDADAGRVYVLSTATLDKSLVMGLCVQVVGLDYIWGCRGLAWSPDSTALVWSDGRGIWLSAYGAQPDLLLTNNSKAARGEPRVFVHASWSPAGGYLLSRLQYFEGSSLSVVDIDTGRQKGVPDSSEYVGPGPVSAWLPDGRYLALIPGGLHYGGDQTLPAQAKVWSIAPTAPLSLTLEHTWTLGASPADIPVGLETLPAGSVSFLQTQLEGQADTSLYRLDLTSGELSLLRTFPHSAGGAVRWLPDASGALVVLVNGDQQSLLYVPADGSSVTDLTAFLGPAAKSFNWAP